MRSMKKLITVICLICGGIFWVIMNIVLLNPEDGFGDNVIVTIKGWDHNRTRDINQYITSNLSSHILPQHFCDYESFLILMVCSAPSNLEAREAIRTTLAQTRNVLGNNVSLFFLLGETSNTSVQYDLVLESDRYGDMIQERFIDSYNNLTLKSVMMLKLVTTYCTSTTKYVLKVDDDIYVNVALLVKTLMERNSTDGLLMGKGICYAKPIRDLTNKWYCPYYFYKEKIYPNYVSGTSYLMSVDVMEKLYITALQTPILHLEDVYLTGICARKAKIKLSNNPLFTYHKLVYDPCLLRQILTAHYFTPEMIVKTYNTLRDPEIEQFCQTKANVFNVNKWFLNNIFKLDKQKRKSKCL